MHVSANSQYHANVRKRGMFSTAMLDVFLKRSNKSKMVRRPGIEPGSTAWKAALVTTIPQTPHENIYFDILIRTLGQKIILGQLLDNIFPFRIRFFTKRLPISHDPQTKAKCSKKAILSIRK